MEKLKLFGPAKSVPEAFFQVSVTLVVYLTGLTMVVIATKILYTYALFIWSIS